MAVLLLAVLPKKKKLRRKRRTRNIWNSRLWPHQISSSSISSTGNIGVSSRSSSSCSSSGISWNYGSSSIIYSISKILQFNGPSKKSEGSFKPSLLFLSVCPPSFSKPPLILVSLDGFRARYLKDHSSHIPVINKLRKSLTPPCGASSTSDVTAVVNVSTPDGSEVTADHDLWSKCVKKKHD